MALCISWCGAIRVLSFDGIVKRLKLRHPGEGRDPELSDINGVRPSPE